MKTNKKKIIIIAGPTGIGKSVLAIELAQKFNGEVIGADSMQIYKRMNIGTGKIRPEEREGIIHYMIDIVDPDEEYSAGQFVLDAKKAIEQVAASGKIPIICGGTGLYISALLNGHTFAKTPKNEEIRLSLKQAAQEKGSLYLYELLKDADPVSAQNISQNDEKRIIRALEIFYACGKPKSELMRQDCKEPDYDYLLFALTENRQSLYQKIENRVDKMLAAGLIDEVESLGANVASQSMQAIGYKETLLFLQNKINYSQMVDMLKINTRRYAKRQITYFKNMPFKKEFIEIQNIKDATEIVCRFLN